MTSGALSELLIQIHVWTVEYDPRVEKDLKGIDRAMQRELLDYMDRRVATDEDPRPGFSAYHAQSRP